MGIWGTAKDQSHSVIFRLPFCHFLLWLRGSVMSDSLRPHGLLRTTCPCPSLFPTVCLNLCPLSQWCHPTISSSAAPFSSCPPSFPASGKIVTLKCRLHRLMKLFSAVCLGVGLVYHRRRVLWTALPLGLGSRRCKGCPIPCSWGFGCSVKLLLQKEVREGKALSFCLSVSMRPETQVQVKGNLKLHPWQNPIINCTLGEMPFEVGFALFEMQADSCACDVFRKTYLLKIV